MASITWTDGTGAASIAPRLNGIAAASRFNAWEPTPVVVGPRHFTLGTETPMVEVLRITRRVTFVVPYLFAEDQALADRLIIHAHSGGQFVVNTTDLAARSYTCTIPEGGDITFGMADGSDLRYELRVAARNTAAAPLVCIYRTGP